ncbi:MAG: efflux RND transporter periplasmic adaptor subunit [Ignavibacteriales bacterium]|nr:efflux RND transporter periplasmic adaptor subunit [Ignavibacteriales bacterium]
MKNERLKTGAVSLLLFFLAIIYYSCNSKKDEQIEAASGAPVKFVNPLTTKMIDYLQLNANTVYLKKEIVRAGFQGYIQKIFKNIGDEVKQGEVLLLLQTKESFAMDNITDKTVEGTKSSVQIKAKSNGILTQLNYHSGDYISEGEQIAVMANPNSLKVTLNVPYQNSSEIKIGQTCNLILPGGRSLVGKITSSIPSMDAESQTQTYLITCNELVVLPENLNLTVKIPIHTINSATVLNKTCVLSNENLDQFWIMKLINDSTAVRMNVMKGIENDSLIQILSPKLNIKDEIISEGGYGLTDTAKIIIVR